MSLLFRTQIVWKFLGSVKITNEWVVVILLQHLAAPINMRFFGDELFIVLVASRRKRLHVGSFLSARRVVNLYTCKFDRIRRLGAFRVRLLYLSVEWRRVYAVFVIFHISLFADKSRISSCFNCVTFVVALWLYGGNLYITMNIHLYRPTHTCEVIEVCSLLARLIPTSPRRS